MNAHTNTPAAEAAPLPQIFGRYLLLQRLSRGGMGEIFLARHGLSGFEKLVVIKKVLPHLAEDQEFLARFIDEAQVAVKLQHANIAQVFEVGYVRDEYFLALEHVDGRDLRRTLTLLGERGRALPVDLALLVARDVASGLAYAHRRTGPGGESLELVHCDVSPPNIMMSFEGETKLIDFGIAKSALKLSGTNPKRGFGKFGYMSPEQLIRGATVDFRTDLYAVGVVLYEMLTGARLYEAGETPDYRALARMVTRGEHPLPSGHDPNLAPYDELVARALKPEPSERYASAAEFRDRIQEALVEVNPTASPDELGAFMRQLFADEVIEQQRRLDAADLTDLDHWRQEMDAASASTVSLALADVPQEMQPQTELVERSSGRYAAVASPVPSRRRQGLWMAAAALAGMAVAGFATAIGIRGAAGPAEGDQTPGSAQPAAPSDQPVVEPLSPEREGDSDPARQGADPVAEEALEPPAVAAAGADASAPRDRARRGRRQRSAGKESRLDSDEVARRFRAVTREYERFRERFGERLESEWTELASFATYHGRHPGKLAELDRRIRRFRARMRKVSARR